MTHFRQTFDLNYADGTHLRGFSGVDQVFCHRVADVCEDTSKTSNVLSIRFTKDTIEYALASYLTIAARNVF